LNRSNEQSDAPARLGQISRNRQYSIEGLDGAKRHQVHLSAELFGPRSQHINILEAQGADRFTAERRYRTCR